MTKYELRRLNEALNTLNALIWNLGSSEGDSRTIRNLKYGLKKLREIKYGKDKN